MSDSDNVNDVSDDGDAIRELTLAELTPIFGPLAALVKMAHDAHRIWCVAHAARFGTETPKFTAWRDNLPLVNVTASVVTPADMSEDYDDVVLLDDAARLSGDASYVASLIVYLNDLLTLAKENLQGIYYDARKSANVDTSDVVKLRAEVDSYILSLTTLAETPQLDAKELWKLFPHKVKVSPKTGARRIVYDGPTIPQTRKVDEFRKNARLGIWIEAEPGSSIVGQVKGEDFGAQCLALGYTIGEFRTNFYPEGMRVEEWRTLPDGRRFHLRKVEKS